MEDFIEISENKFDLPKINKTDITVFTSKNAVKSVFNQYPNLQIQNNTIACVGSKTAQLLKANRVPVNHIANSAAQLGKWLIKNSNEDQNILHFCGNIKREELKKISVKNKLNYSEIEVYTTKLTPKKINFQVDGILFLSPSSVISFIEANNPSDKAAFCLGETTANEAKKNFNTVIVSKIPTVENSLKTIEQYYGNI